VFPAYYGCLQNLVVVRVFKVYCIQGSMKKHEVQAEISKFFRSKHTPAGVKKIKRLAMRNLIKLGEFRKLCCKKCYSMELRTIGVKKGVKRIECKACAHIARYKIKN